jgi:hypothetical protein
MHLLPPVDLGANRHAKCGRDTPEAAEFSAAFFDN